jgi:DNA-binding NarL/FixJ family response regulator
VSQSAPPPVRDARPEPAAGRRIAVVEDDPVLRAYLETVITGADGLELVGSGASVVEGLALARREPDLLLLDLGLPDGSGLEVIAAVRTHQPACKVLVITVFEDRASVVKTLQAGADGYVLKDMEPGAIAGHIDATLRGETPISSRAARHLLSIVRDGEAAPSVTGARPEPGPASRPAPSLTPRERELLELIARGMNRKECARAMGLSPFTVAEYTQGIFRKLQVSSRGEAVYEAVQARLIDLDRL